MRAQTSELLTVTAAPALPLSAQSQEVLDKTKASTTLKQISYVRVGNLAKLLKNGELTFTLPGVGRLVAKTNRLEVLSETNYKWIGELKGSDPFGYVYLYSQEGNVSGYILSKSSHSISNRWERACVCWQKQICPG